jgi:hypothetical protein
VEDARGDWNVGHRQHRRLSTLIPHRNTESRSPCTFILVGLLGPIHEIYRQVL